MAVAVSRFQLDAGKIEETVVTLARRIAERFPQSGLHGLCQHLHSVAAAARKRALEIQKPIVSVRIASVLMILAILSVPVDNTRKSALITSDSPQAAIRGAGGGECKLKLNSDRTLDALCNQAGGTVYVVFK